MIQIKRILLCTNRYSPMQEKPVHSPLSCQPTHGFPCQQISWQGRAQLGFPLLQEDVATHVPWPGYDFVADTTGSF